MTQTIITWILIAIAVVFFAKRLYDRINGRGNNCGCGGGAGCNCGCGGNTCNNCTMSDCPAGKNVGEQEKA